MARRLLQGATIIDGVADAGYSGSVLVDGEKIAGAGPGVSAAGDTEVIDCRGLFICPGLTDSHCHLIYNDAKDLYDLEIAKSIPEATLDAVSSAQRLLELGFTTIRDLGSRANIGVVIRRAIEAGQIPDRACSPPGHHHHRGRPAGRAPQPPVRRREVPARSRSQDQRTVGGAGRGRQQVKDGVDWIKTETSGMGFNPMCPAERDTTSDEELGAVVDEATRKQRPVAVHAESRMGVLKAARAGVRTIEHGIFMDDEGLELILAKDIAYSPTLALYVGLADWGAAAGIPPEIVELQQGTRERHIEAVRRAYRASATIIAGSDAGVPGFPQGSAVKEAEAYVDVIGMSPMEALKSLTSTPAEVFGLGERTGSIRPGRDADLVIFSADPLADIRVLGDDRSRVAVLKAGSVVAGRLGPAAR